MNFCLSWKFVNNHKLKLKLIQRQWFYSVSVSQWLVKMINAICHVTTKTSRHLRKVCSHYKRIIKFCCHTFIRSPLAFQLKILCIAIKNWLKWQHGNKSIMKFLMKCSCVFCSAAHLKWTFLQRNRPCCMRGNKIGLFFSMTPKLVTSFSINYCTMLENRISFNQVNTFNAAEK